MWIERTIAYLLALEALKLKSEGHEDAQARLNGLVLDALAQLL